jgi:hypothetical protein
VLVSALNTWFGSVLAAETFHADVHAGNLLVLKDGRVGFLDFGIVGRISPITFKVGLHALSTFLCLFTSSFKCVRLPYGPYALDPHEEYAEEEPHEASGCRVG